MAFHEIEWYDRNPEVILRSYNADALAPHINELRWQYTVPKDRMAFVELLDLMLMRIDVAAPVGVADASIWCWPAGIGGPGAVTLLCALLFDNTAGAHIERNVGHTMILLEGYAVSCQTYDQSTGGTVSYRANMKATEFDAFLYHAAPKTRPRPEVDVQEPSKYPSDPEM